MDAHPLKWLWGLVLGGKHLSYHVFMVWISFYYIFWIQVCQTTALPGPTLVLLLPEQLVPNPEADSWGKVYFRLALWRTADTWAKVTDRGCNSPHGLDSDGEVSTLTGMYSEHSHLIVGGAMSEGNREVKETTQDTKCTLRLPCQPLSTYQAEKQKAQVSAQCSLASLWALHAI